MILHGYWRSSAAWRVRIVLALKGLTADQVPHHLRDGGQRAPDYLALNPQGLVPALQTDDGRVLTQSLAICEYLDEIAPEPPLLPGDPANRARIRAAALVVAADIHPIQNLKILRRIKDFGQDEQAWARQVIEDGFNALEALLAKTPGPFAFGATPTLADVCLVPQMTNARRFNVELRWPRIQAIEAECLKLDAFRLTAAEHQPDAE
ncbi:maleylacetoacetate isomerase [Brevundimonas sp. VNH65]|uniref:maleylacetoacetate isomerase n=1 Tax=Brevundimonas sp. VNH65 TaxID=3400917 RepID=UPI003C11E0EF